MNQKKFQFGKFHVILILMALVVITMGATTTLSREVKLILDGEEFLYDTTANTVIEFMDEKGLEVVDGMYVSPGFGTAISNKMEIEVRYPRKVTIIDDGIEKTVMSASILVKDVLSEQKIALSEKDYTIPEIGARIDFDKKTGPEIIINRVLDIKTTEMVNVPHDSVQKENPDMPKGQSKIVTQGKNGTAIVTTESKTLNKSVIKNEVLNKEILEEPITEVVEVGTKDVITKNGREVKQVLKMQATAYDAGPASNGNWVGITALGTKLRPGVVAVDKNIIPLGTELYVESADGYPSYGMAIAEDVGGAIKGNRIDLFFESTEKVFDFGRRNVIVYVLK